MILILKQMLLLMQNLREVDQFMLIKLNELVTTSQEAAMKIMNLLIFIMTVNNFCTQ